MKFLKVLSLFVMIFTNPFLSVTAQQKPQIASVKCGDIVDSEMTPGTYFQDTILAVQAGTKIDITITPLGNSFNLFVFLVDSGGGEMTRFNSGAAGIAEEMIGYQLSSSNTTLRVFGVKSDYVDTFPKTLLAEIMSSVPNRGYSENYFGGIGGYYGAYTISLGCTLRDGTRIEPGQSATATQPLGGSNNAASAPAFSGIGFPGLAPVDFANAFTNELTLGQPANSKIPPSGDAVLGYTFNAAANDTLALSFTRASGNLNLGLVVLSADNKVVFQASLVTSSELTTKFTLPSDGIYTIGIFRIDLLPPAVPEATAFQLTATLNP